MHNRCSKDADPLHRVGPTLPIPIKAYVPWITSQARPRSSKWCRMSPNTSCSMYTYAISPRLVSNEDVPLRVRDHAFSYYSNTQTEHCSTSCCPPWKDSKWRWWIWGLLLKSGRIRSILDTVGQKNGSYRRGSVLQRKKFPCDLMMGCASETFRKPQGPPTSGTVWCQWYHLNPASVRPVTNGCKYLFRTLEWQLINICKNEYYARIWTRPDLDTMY